MDLSQIRTSFDYLSQLKKGVFAIICQLGPLTFFVTFTSAKSKWFPLLQCLYDFNSKKLRFDMPFDKLETKHIANLIQFNPITSAHYYDHHMKCFQKLCMKNDMIFGPFLDFFFVIECDSEKLTPNFYEAQRYCHKKNCRKKNQVICHFNFPWSPME
jgi:hypothetical protein